MAGRSIKKHKLKATFKAANRTIWNKKYAPVSILILRGKMATK